MTAAEPGPGVPASPEHAPCREAVAELRHSMLVATDRAVGAEAAAERLEATAAASAGEVARQAAAIAALTGERDRLRAELAAVRASRTWRIGRLVVAPAARLARGRK